MSSFPFVRIGLSFAFIVIVLSASCSKKGSSPKSDDDVDDVYAEDAPASDSGSTSDDSVEGGTAESGARDRSAETVKEADPEAVKLIKRMKKAYATCRTYQDEGEIFARHLDEDGDDSGYGDRRRVFTNFVRPDCLRLEVVSANPFSSGEASQVWWMCGQETRTIGAEYSNYLMRGEDSEGEKISESDRIYEAVCGESIVPTLLLPKRAQSKTAKTKTVLDGFRLPQFDGEEDIDGRACHRVFGPVDVKGIAKYSRDNPFLDDGDKARMEVSMTLWIDKESLAIRKVEEIVKTEFMGDIPIPGAGPIQVADSVFVKTSTFHSNLNTPQQWSDIGVGLLDTPADVDGAIFGGKSFQPYKKGRKAARSLGRKTLNSVKKRYGDCKSYCDSGVMTLVAASRAQPEVKRLDIETAYQRDGSVRWFSRYKNDKGDSIRQLIWGDGTAFKYWYSESDQVMPAEKPSVLVFELEQGFTLPAGMILKLLDEQSFGASEIGQTTGPIVVGTERIGGSSCYKIQGRGPQNVLTFIWVEKKSKLIRRIETTHIGGGYGYWTTLEINDAVFDKKIPSRKLSFDERGD